MTKRRTDFTQLRTAYLGFGPPERTADYVGFLREHRATVTIVEPTDLSPASLEDVDLLIADGEVGGAEGMRSVIDAFNGIEWHDFPCPVMLIGGVGGLIADELSLKLGGPNSCLCLQGEAIVFSADHRIFNEPDPVQPESIYETSPPRQFTEWSEPGSVPSSIRLLRVHKDTPAEDSGGSSDPGLVVAPFGMEGPDAESIVGGINDKGYDYVAVGRHGRFVLFGFATPPTQMTEAGRTLLWNTVCYAADQRGQKVLEMVRQEPVELVEHFVRTMDYDDDPDNLQSALHYFFGETAPLAADATTVERRTFLEELGPYLRRIDDRFGIDDDARRFGLPLADPQLLWRCLDAVQSDGDEAAAGSRLYARLTGRGSDDVSAERAWLHDVADDLFYSSLSGDRYLLRSNGDSDPIIRRSQALSLKQDGAILQLSAARVTSGDRQGEMVATVYVSGVPGHRWLYAPGDSDPKSMVIRPVDGLSIDGAVTCDPEPVDGQIRSDTAISVPLSGDGTSLTLVVRIQVCDSVRCDIPSMATLSVPIPSPLIKGVI